ncbi:MAG TPA: type VI secretion system accessory protein TagJ [Polyangiaceae bacterium]|nr:type VI secretion system accessory protein TagJ [Polyangiaceae bacterium]
MLAEDKLRAGQVDEALALLQDEIRKSPGNVRYRVFLFQLLSVLGQWDRAWLQLKTSGDLDPQCLPMVQTYRELLRCEVFRSHVFAGSKTPVFLGEPQPWAALLVQALRRTAEGKHDDAQELRSQAFDSAPTTSGQVDGKRFSWIADGDVRLGPVLEMIVHGRYTWLPFHQVRSLRIEPPKDLRDLVWMPVILTLVTGGELVAFIPSRYPGAESHSDAAVRLARRTDWTEIPGGYLGAGQRVWTTDEGEHALFDVREVDLDVDVVDENVVTDG